LVEEGQLIMCPGLADREKFRAAFGNRIGFGFGYR
jgi:hypothetical protein